MILPGAVDSVLAEIARRAALTLDQAEALPPDAYRSDAVLALERERIFGREWLCVGRGDEIPEVGD